MPVLKFKLPNERNETLVRSAMLRALRNSRKAWEAYRIDPVNVATIQRRGDRTRAAWSVSRKVHLMVCLANGANKATVRKAARAYWKALKAWKAYYASKIAL